MRKEPSETRGIYQGTINETEHLLVDELYHNHYQHITNTIYDGRSVSRNEFLAYNLEMYWQKTHTWKWKYRKHRLNMKQLDESQKTQSILFIKASKKIIELQNPSTKASEWTLTTHSSSIEATFIMLWAPETNLKIEPNSVTKWVINPESLFQILTNSWDGWFAMIHI